MDTRFYQRLGVSKRVAEVALPLRADDLVKIIAPLALALLRRRRRSSCTFLAVPRRVLNLFFAGSKTGLYRGKTAVFYLVWSMGIMVGMKIVMDDENHL